MIERRGVEIVRPLPVIEHYFAVDRPLETAFTELDPHLQQDVFRLERYDRLTFIHTLNVAVIIGKITPGKFGVLARKVGLVHDLGKLDISSATINEPGLLSKAQWEEVKNHVLFGVKRVLPYDQFLALAMIDHHREKGYPTDEEREEAIGNRPPPSRLLRKIRSRLVLADQLEAVRSRRAYKGEIPEDEAKAILYEAAPGEEELIDRGLEAYNELRDRLKASGLKY